MAMQDIGDETRRKIITNARTLFYKDGFKKTTIDAIAQATNTSHALVHYHFKTKDNLMYEVGLSVTEEQFLFVDEYFASENSFVRALIATFLFWDHAIHNKQFLEFCSSIFETTLSADLDNYYRFFLKAYENVSDIGELDDKRRYLIGAASRGMDFFILELIKKNPALFSADEVADFTIQADLGLFGMTNRLSDIEKARKLAHNVKVEIDEGVFVAG